MVLPVLPVLLLLPLLVFAHPTPHPDGSDCSSVQRALPSRWYHEPGHPVEQLFKRQNGDNPNDGVAYPPVGSSEWSAGFPGLRPVVADLPKEWVDALNSAVTAGKIPNIPAARLSGGNPVYPSSVNASSPEVCSGAIGCRNPYDIWDAPDGVLAISFDDGPSLGSAKLYDYLLETKTPSTQFMIGYNIKQNPALFTRAFAELDLDIAIHTWSHRPMTTLSNLELVAEFGWSMEIIKNSTGGRLPKFWRPPYGDADNRVRAIASEIFGLKTVFWNQDTLDWTLATGSTSLRAINASMTRWLNGPKHPGLVILEHDLDNDGVQAFIDAHPVMVSTGWKLESVADITGDGAYQNSKDGTSPVARADGVLGRSYSLPTSTSTSASTPAEPTTSQPNTSGGGNSTGTNTSQSGNGSTQSTMSRFTSVFGAIFLTVVFYAW